MLGHAGAVRRSNRSLHSVWDASTPRKLRGLSADTNREEDKAAAVGWAEDIYERLQAKESKDAELCAELDRPDCVLQWATESNRLVCSPALRHAEKWILEHDPSREDFEENARVLEEQAG